MSGEIQATKRPVAKTRATRGTAKAGGHVASSKEKDFLVNSVGYALRRAQVRSDEALMRYLTPPMSPARLSTLSTVGSNPGISQSALASILNIAGPSVVKVIDDLEQMGILSRERTADRRSYALHLTPFGLDEHKRHGELVQAFEREIAAGLTAAERSQLLSLLAKIAPTER